MTKPTFQNPKNILLFSDCNDQNIRNLLKKFQLKLIVSNADSKIPGSYWGDSEAGLISNTVYVRSDTPIHSLLHETCHYICMDKNRRDQLHTNAEGDYDEENGVCYLQIILSNEIPEMGQKRMMKDMDSWGYTFRLGSSEEWFKNDAEDALNWLQKHRIVDANSQCKFSLRS